MAIFSAPHPRFRIYTQPRSYILLLADLIFKRIAKGADVEKLEKALAEQFKVSYVVAAPMARAGIYLALKHLIKPGQAVIMSPYTIADVVNMVILAGGKPVFCDIEQNSCNIDPDKIEQLIDAKTGAVLITHLHGIAADAQKILEICRKYNLPLVEDAAQSFGGYANGKRLGTIGDVGIYSFGMYKNINSWYGGAIVSENKDLIDKIRSELNQYDYQSGRFILKRALKGLITDFLTHPFIFQPLTYWIFRFGFLHNIKWINKRIETELDLSRKDEIPVYYLRRFTPFQARLATSQLNKIEQENKIRIRKSEIYRKGLEGLSDLILPLKEKENGSFIYTTFPVQYEDRKDLLRWLMLHKRDIAAQHLKNCADLPAFSDFYRDCPVARKTANEVLLLPTYPRYPNSEVQKNIDVIRTYFLSPFYPL